MDNRFRSPRLSGLQSRDHIFLTPAIISEFAENQLLGMKRVDIRFVQQDFKRLGPAGKVVKQKVKPITDEPLSENRAMGSESDGLDFCDDAIEKVAKANSVRLDTTQILPEVSASPCAFHTKSDRSKNELLYMTNHHAGHLPLKRLKQKPVSKTSVNTRSRVPRIPTDMDIGQLEKDLDKFPKYPSALPGHMPSKEFVMTWLLHGSEPENHFPELNSPKDVKRPLKGKRQKLGVVRNSFISE